MGHEPPPIRRRITIDGIVQGVGFRPFAWRRATRLGLSGWVGNDLAGVVLEVQGSPEAVAAFLDGLTAAAPPFAAVDRIDVADVPAEPSATRGFEILPSMTAGRRTTHVPADSAPCPACLEEFHHVDDRRYRYPFVNCTDCGPRYTIITGLPYDRAATTMAEFPMCPRCAAEYGDPADRRFHAEPVACPDCGPVVWFAARDDDAALTRSAAGCHGEAAVTAARDLLVRGGILAVKGVGGFHLACDATNATSVALLRHRKHRVGKPFAVMVSDADAAGQLARVDEAERRLLEGADRPVVLLQRSSRANAAPRVADEVAPGLDVIGVMLPPTPLHHLLAEMLPPLVMTSGNLTEEPIATTNADAVRRLAPLVDGFLLHDRAIHVACDDSVVRRAAGMTLPVRRSRGRVPLPIRLPRSGPPVLAVGGELKAAICLARNDDAVLGHHIGDVGNLETLEALDHAASHLMRLLAISPAAVIADLHPGYLSAAWAERFAADRGIPCIRVQHHEAHVAALLAEHGYDLTSAPDGFVGCCFDGTGFGSDGVIRGGEFLVLAGGSLSRGAQLLPFALPGGDAAIRHPWRVALAALAAANIEWSDGLPPVDARRRGELALLRRQLDRRLNCPSTTSMGRLFDVVSAVLGAVDSVTYEAEAAMKLEALAAASPVPLPGYVIDAACRAAVDGPVEIDWRELLQGIVAAVRHGVAAAGIAAGFHDATARMIADTCRLLRDRGAARVVGLTGGVFQNAVLVERTLDGLHRAGFEVLTHRAVPPNDGGLALGQAVLGRHQIRPRMQ